MILRIAFQYIMILRSSTPLERMQTFIGHWFKAGSSMTSWSNAWKARASHGMK